MHACGVHVLPPIANYAMDGAPSFIPCGSAKPVDDGTACGLPARKSFNPQIRRLASEGCPPAAAEAFRHLTGWLSCAMLVNKMNTFTNCDQLSEIINPDFVDTGNLSHLPIRSSPLDLRPQARPASTNEGFRLGTSRICRLVASQAEERVRFRRQQEAERINLPAKG